MLAALMVCYMALNGGVVLRAAGFRCIEAKALFKNLTEFVITRLFSSPYIVYLEQKLIKVYEDTNALFAAPKNGTLTFNENKRHLGLFHTFIIFAAVMEGFFCFFPETFMTHQFRHSRRGSLYYLKKIRQM
ncbi:hypothetical protein OUZ56_024945 [Daphnia magna]|uniref:ABC transmembrane type-1 domain-containing protein n=1 Tax=Daphnia magna TaxID=35525 RepID=A0ABQ9ZIH2_9CRUS|nr:hypothetical protein OUZ56_024945 [Daphnia magna]